MAQNREHLDKLLDFIKLIIRDSSNKKFTEDLRKALKVESSASTLLSDDRYEQLSELCVEKVISEQGQQFYKEFPIQEIVPKLVEDFVRMESFKRRDNFEDFCLATYQQVEAIVNWFCSQDWFDTKYQEDFDKVFYVDRNGVNITYGKHILNTKDFVQQRGKKLSGLFFNMRLRAVLHYVYFDSKNVYGTFKLKYDSLNDLYLCRNLNHRGGESSDYQQNRINDIYPQRYLYYLGFTGVLADFVTNIAKNYKVFEE